MTAKDAMRVLIIIGQSIIISIACTSIKLNETKKALEKRIEILERNVKK